MWYKLEDKTKSIVPCSSNEYYKWASEDFNRKVVCQETFEDYWVSTVFLGLDHGFNNEEPILFETMVFPPNRDWSEIYCNRCSTWEEAEEMHKETIAKLEKGEIK